MSLGRTLKQTLRSRLSVLRRDRPAALGVLFHGLFLDSSEIEHQRLDAQQGITMEQMRHFIEHFLAAGYHFISPEEERHDLDAEGRYLFITFDDGYANNLRMLPLLEEYAIPATFYVTTGNIEEQTCFWWDVVHRERSRQGIPRAEISREQKLLKNRPHDQIIAYLRREFGPDCLRPWSDTDRPMTLDELKELAAHPWARVGNHTRDHHLLDRYSRTEVREQIRRAQEDLGNWLGRPPRSIAYPNGNFSADVAEAARAEGLTCGLTLEKHKNRLPLEGDFRLGRFTLWGNQDIDRQCRIFRSDLPL